MVLQDNDLSRRQIKFSFRMTERTIGLNESDIGLVDEAYPGRGFFMFDRQIGDPYYERHLPNLKQQPKFASRFAGADHRNPCETSRPENFKKSGELDVTEFKEQAVPGFELDLKHSVLLQGFSVQLCPRFVPKKRGR